ncbi:hypothetical protein MFUL124B02_39890 [Myxococcus fulvus 124B02]|nr:hypothetical protein MFUL124B02_39890 [Myxococcus fulvus 124B02]
MMACGLECGVGIARVANASVLLPRESSPHARQSTTSFARFARFSLSVQP